MSEMKYVYGPIPSRRLGRSLGVSPIPKKACNYILPRHPLNQFELDGFLKSRNCPNTDELVDRLNFCWKKIFLFFLSPGIKKTLSNFKVLPA